MDVLKKMAENLGQVSQLRFDLPYLSLIIYHSNIRWGVQIYGAPWFCIWFFFIPLRHSIYIFPLKRCMKFDTHVKWHTYLWLNINILNKMIAYIVFGHCFFLFYFLCYLMTLSAWRCVVHLCDLVYLTGNVRSCHVSGPQTACLKT
jgi:hypothetical protein